MFRTFVIATLAFIAGAGVTYFIVVGGFLLAWEMLGVHDQDGGGAMALGLVIGPICAVFGGIICAIAVPMWITKRKGHTGPTTTEEKRRDIRRFGIVGGALVAGFVGYKFAQLIYWFVLPSSFDSHWKVVVIIWLPTVIAVLSALAGGLFTHRLTRLSKSNHPEDK